MARTSKIVKNEDRKVIVARYAEKRAALKATIISATASEEEKQAAASKLRSLPRDQHLALLVLDDLARLGHVGLCDAR